MVAPCESRLPTFSAPPSRPSRHHPHISVKSIPYINEWISHMWIYVRWWRSSCVCIYRCAFLCPSATERAQRLEKSLSLQIATIRRIAVSSMMLMMVLVFEVVFSLRKLLTHFIACLWILCFSSHSMIIFVFSLIYLVDHTRMVRREECLWCLYTTK